MVAISLMIEGQDGLNWARWQRLAAEAEALGFAGLFRSDHFTNPQPPELDSLELVVSLAYLATNTSRIHFGPLVAPVSFRDPIMFARQAAALDDLSGGRMILGLGAGWNQREHSMFGYPLGDVETRMARYQEGLEVAARLSRSDEPISYEGHFYQLHEAILLPRPQRPGGPRILVGGNGPKRTLALAARYADIWNGVFLTPSAFRERSGRLDELLRRQGREPGEVRRTIMLTVLLARDEVELERRLEPLREDPSQPARASAEQLREHGRALAGTPEEIAAQIHAYIEAGAEEVMLQWLDLDDIDGLHVIANEVFPKLS